ncbi:FUSC family protein [Georgenia sp. TF02-10]|uniref:FUSC family protein n=1 Tax=Georgenia sp. TF02-10 TaxID=2917725 RepID=UPI001FA7D024|nr:FUSC family protein [Georgenia sp. TF02-10]UNX54520.1 FUSC family protein [Georgenia sp. TF02-10]
MDGRGGAGTPGPAARGGAGSSAEATSRPAREADRRAGEAVRLIAVGLGQSMDPRRWRVFLGVRARQGARRVRTAALPVATAALAAGIAYFVSGEVLNHAVPLFAPIAAWVCLGFQPERQLRRVAEMGAGVAVGVGLGELFVQVFGAGPVQIAVVLLVSALIARFLDRGQLLTTQAGVQSIVIVAMPAAMLSGGALGRWSDAAVGALVALVVAALLPGDVHRRPRALAREAMGDLAGMLSTLGRALRTGDAQLAADALAQGRASQETLESWTAATRSAAELARVNPARRADRPVIGELSRAATLADRAMRNARVVARRGVLAVEEDGPVPEIADQVEALAAGARSLGASLGRGEPPEQARAMLADVAAALVPEAYASQGWRQQTLVSLLRSLAVDALQMTGLSYRQAVRELGEP